MVFISTLPLSRISLLCSETEQFRLIALMSLILHSTNLYRGAVCLAHLRGASLWSCVMSRVWTAVAKKRRELLVQDTRNLGGFCAMATGAKHTPFPLTSRCGTDVIPACAVR
jgi:hypothetical protein